MSVTTLTLSDFLLARIAEDEGVARDAQFNNGKWTFSGDWLGGAVVRDYGPDVVPWRSNSLAATDAAHIALHDPARVLAECEAKRRIVHRFQMFTGMTELTKMEIRHNELLDVLHWLALPYADHPDYDEGWRP